MRDLIFNKIEELQKSVPTLKKFFVLDPEELKIDPEGYLEVIEDYLTEHDDKIQDFKFESWIDDETFSIILMLTMTLKPEISAFMFRGNALNNLVPSKIEAEILREKTQHILQKYGWEFNTKETRAQIVAELTSALGVDEIIDRTTDETIDTQKMDLFIKNLGNEFEINGFLRNIADKGRFQ